MPKQVLIADDTIYMRSVIKDILVNAGLKVIAEAEDGVSAVNLYRKWQPDLVILNIVMPNLTGLEALSQIKTWDPNAKVILCSALAQAPTVFSAIEAGADDFVIKPFSPQQLIDAMHRVLNLKRIQPAE